ncbi:class I SAM-dependent methyltransferase [Brevibacillus sp. 179-C9.3 HS]|uniref:class I SAM-dependent methyltransferase n=1 Tax=unclassified Brevibacillus TaxID=2684853 RepID=UPI00399EF4A1
MNLTEQFGNMDIYLFDQLLKGRVTPDMQILDAGCGSGRNLVYFLRNGYTVYAVDQSEKAIETVQRVAQELAADWSTERARVEPIENLSFENESFDFIISNAVLHFAENEEHFHQMLEELWRVLKPGGILFMRLASSIGMEGAVQPLGNERYLLPDGSTRFLVNERTMMGMTDKLQGVFLEPIKTVNVAGQRCMSTWVIKKNA